MHILVANAPDLYRDAVATLIVGARPQHTVTVVKPAALDRRLLRDAPDLVICSALTTLVQTRAPAWLLLYPGGADLGVLMLRGRRTILESVTFDGLLRCLDLAEARLVAAGPQTAA